MWENQPFKGPEKDPKRPHHSYFIDLLPSVLQENTKNV